MSKSKADINNIVKNNDNFKSVIPTLKDTNIHYFDYAATTFMPEQVMDKWREINCNSGVFISRGNSSLTQKAELELFNAEECFHKFFNLSDEYDFIYSKNVTESINVLALSLMDLVHTPDIILVGPYEHHSNYLPWKHLAKKTGALFCEMPVDIFGNPDYSFIEKNKKRIKILSLSCVSNSFGYLFDIEKVCNIIDENTLLFIDQSQVTAHMPMITNKKISAHFIASHKMYGPKNIASIAIKKELLDKLPPIFLGGGMVETVGFKDTWLNDRRKFLAGTMDIGLIGAWAEACKFISDISYSKIQQINKKHSQEILEILKKYNFNHVCIDNQCVDYVISFTHNDIHAHDINDFFAKNNVVIRSGNLCSQNALRKIKSYAINRISLGIGVDSQDIQKLDEVIGEMIR